MTNHNAPVEVGYEYIYTPYITRNGVKIPPPNGLKVWRLKVKKKKAV